MKAAKWNWHVIKYKISQSNSGNSIGRPTCPLETTSQACCTFADEVLSIFPTTPEVPHFRLIPKTNHK